MKFKWFQLIHALPRECKKAISMHDGNLENPLIHDHHLIKKNQILCLTKLNSNELYKIQIIIKYKKPTSQSYFEKIFKKSNLDWKAIYLLLRIATVDTTIRVFLYKLLNNVLFLNKMLYRFGISQDSLCSFCNLEEEIPMHIFYSCNHTQILRETLKYYIQNNLDLPSLTSHSVILGFTDSSESENFIIINHLLVIFKYYIFKSRSNKHLSFLQLKTDIMKVKTLEENLSNADNNKSKRYHKKWRKISNIFV